MQLRNSAEQYGLIAQTCHWLTVGLVVLAWILGQFGDNLPSQAAEQAGLFVHMSAGLLVIALVVVRLAWRVADPPPPPEPSSMGWLIEKSATVTHYALYILLVAAPIVGIVVQFARGRPIPLFGIGEIASPWAADRAFSRSAKDVHEWLANALMVLALLHAAAALVHHWLFRDRTLKRMLPHGAQ